MVEIVKVRAPNSVGGLTLVEVTTMILLALFLWVLFFIRLVKVPSINPMTSCRNQLKVVGLALEEYAADHNGHFPWELFETNAGSREASLTGVVYPLLQRMSNYLRTPKVVLCPADHKRSAAREFLLMTDMNISYFLSLEAFSPDANLIRAGDRNLEVEGRAVRPGLFLLTTNASARWTWELHSRIERRRCGNVLFSDGSADTAWDALAFLPGRQTKETNLLIVP